MSESRNFAPSRLCARPLQSAAIAHLPGPAPGNGTAQPADQGERAWKGRSRSGFPLRGTGRGASPPSMRPLAACLIASVFCLTACEEKKEITVTESRAPTTRDATPRLSATSDERFRDAKPSPVTAETPSSWLVLPASQIRLLNYRFGESGMGEVWVSVSGGSVLDNVNRWLGQFAAAPLDAAGLAKLPSVSLAGGEAENADNQTSSSGSHTGGTSPAPGTAQGETGARPPLPRPFSLIGRLFRPDTGSRPGGMRDRCRLKRSRAEARRRKVSRFRHRDRTV